MDDFRALVFGRAEDERNDLLYRVDSPSGLNLRVGRGVGEKIIKNLPHGTVVHVVDDTGDWWLVAEVVDGDDDVTGFEHRGWLVSI